MKAVLLLVMSFVVAPDLFAQDINCVDPGRYVGNLVRDREAAKPNSKEVFRRCDGNICVA